MESLAGQYASCSSSSSSSCSSESSLRVAADPDPESNDDFTIVSITPRSPLEARPASSASSPSSMPVGPSARPISDAALPYAALPDAGLLAWVEEARALRAKGLRFEDSLRSNPRFQNPAVCAKMVAFCGLDEYGTGVEGLGVCAKQGGFYDVLSEKQRRAAEESAAKGAPSKMMLQQQELGQQQLQRRG